MRRLNLRKVLSIGENVWRQDSCRAGSLAQFLHQFFSRGIVMVAARVFFHRDDNVAHKAFDRFTDALRTI